METNNIFTFNGMLPEKGEGRHEVIIPINMEKISKKWIGKAKIIINGKEYLCHIINKRNGYYSFLIVKDMLNNVGIGNPVDITVEFTKSIDISDSPYSIQNPIRIVDNIKYIEQPTFYTCGQACIAMLADVSVEDVCKVMGTGMNEGAWDEHMLTALDYYGFEHSGGFRGVKNKENPKLPDICILGIKMPTYRHSVLYYKGIYYDPEFGVLDKCHPDGIISTFWKILQ